MKKSLVCIILIVILVVLTSCNSKVVDDQTNQTISVEKENLSNSKIVDPPSETTELSNEKIPTDRNDQYYQGETYSIAPSELADTDKDRPNNNSDWIRTLNINYPQLYNLVDTQKQIRINDLLYTKAISYHNILENRDYIDYALTYQIMDTSDEFISILFSGEVSDFQASNRFAYAVTLNIRDEKEACLDDFINIRDTSISSHLISEFDIIENNFETIEENIPYIEQFIESYSNSTHISDFYIKENVIGIIIPTFNSMGYILIEGNIK